MENETLKFDKAIFEKEDGTTFECGFRTVSMDVKDKMLAVTLKNLAEQEEINKQYPEMKSVRETFIKLDINTQRRESNAIREKRGEKPEELEKITEEEMNALIDMMNDVEQSIRFMEYGGKMQRIVDISNIHKIKCIIQPRHLTDEETELINSDVTSKFWRSQDTDHFSKISNFFREKYKV